MTTLAFTDEVRAAVARVGLRPEQVVEVLGSCLDGEAVYLVGSLAAGLGNAGSDIDLHVFVTERAQGVVPMLFFADRVRLDLVHHETGRPAAVLATTPVAAVALCGGQCALGPLPDMTDLKRLSRWATAVPLYSAGPPLFDRAETARAAAAVVRLAVDVTVRTAAVASILTAAGAAHAPLAWSRAADVAVEAAVRAAGEIFIGDKWLPVKARRAGFAPDVVAGARAVDSAAAYDRFVATLGIPVADPTVLVSVHQAPTAEFTFGDRRFQLHGDRLVPALELPSPSLPAALDAVGAHRLRAAITAGAVSLTVDPDAVDRRLR